MLRMTVKQHLIEKSDASLFGACLIGPASSMAAERAIVAAPWRVWQIKRLICLDTCSVPESQLLWHAMRTVANERGETLVFVAYADPAAHDARSSLPLTGRVYLASNFFYAGETAHPRTAVIDAHGRARSSRQGAVTLGRRTLPEGWRMQRIPPARVWVTICTPEERVNVTGVVQPTSQRWRKHQWRRAWAALNPQRLVAARQWVSHVAWRRLVRSGKIPIGQPKPQHIRTHERFQPAYWAGAELTRTAAPVWVPYAWQQELIFEEQVCDERTAGRRYLPRAGHITGGVL